MTTRLLILLLICCWRSSVIGSPADDLGSPSQGVRDAAAKVLRSSYIAPPRANWEAVVDSITDGMTKTKLLELLAPYHVTTLGGFGSGSSHSQTYRLDDAWILVCGFRNQGDVLYSRTLSPSLRSVWVAPPSNFTGIWITYFVNGEKSHEIHYDDGKYHGEFIAYSPDGSKSVVQHYDHHISEGADTGYYPSGRTKYEGVYKAGKMVGTWIWYKEDGSVESTKECSK